MQTFPSYSSGFSEVMAEPLEAFDAVLLYDTIDAGKRGMSTLARMTGLRDDDLVEIRPHPWRLDFMHDPDAFENALQDIFAAHVIILSTSGSEPLPFAFKIWFATILDQKKGERVAVITLLGLDEGSARAASRDFHFIKQQTLDAGFDFFAPWFGRRDLTDKDLEMEPVVEIDIEVVPAY